MKIRLLFTLLVLAVSACGKYGPPLPPEAFSAKAVKTLQVAPENSGVRFKWESPDSDIRGRELKSMDGYLVYRKEIFEPSDMLEEVREFDLIGRVEDKHVLIREKLREEARASGRPSRRVEADPELKKFEYLDSTVKPGFTYLYQIIPLNQGSVEGEVRQSVKVFFTGESSQVEIIEGNPSDEEIL